MAGRQIAVVAKAATAGLAPYEDPSWEIWGIPWIKYPRVTRLFDVHTTHWRTQKGWGAETNPIFHSGSYIEEANKLDVPLYCLPDTLPQYKNGIVYPLDDVTGETGRAYLECSIPYMLALAIHEHAHGRPVERIGLWGVNFLNRFEDRWQLPCTTYWIGVAEGRGIKVHVAPGSPLMMSLYVAGRYGQSRERRFTET